MRSISSIRFDSLEFTQQECSEDPLVADYEPIVLVSPKNLKYLDRNLFLPDTLPEEGRQLYNLIQNVELPEWLSYAISASIDNKNCVLYNKLQEKLKKNPFGDEKSLYIRVPLGKKIICDFKLLL